MATVNKTSIREEIIRLKKDFEHLCEDGKVSPEIRAVMNSLLMVVELILAVFLEKKTRKTNKNSSIPSSQTEKDETAKADRGAKGRGQKVCGEVKNTRIKETTIIAKADTCSSCGYALDDTPCDEHERRTKIDIVFEKVVENIDAEIKQCPNCDSTVKGQFPRDMQGKLQYGNGIKAFAIHLIISQMVSLNRVQKQISAMIGSALSEATLLKFVWRLHLSLEQWEENAIEDLLKAPSVHVDETSFRVEKKNYWIHVC